MMEPIRPDKDDLRAGANRTGKSARKTNSNGSGKPPANSAPPDKPGSSGGWLFLVLLLVAGAAGFGWFQQEERIQYLESQLEEAEYWSRQSKLALARFEGELSDTGESLQEKGQSIEEQLGAQEGRLDAADSEIRKLWGVANDRNKKQLDDHESRLEEQSGALTAAEAQRESLAASIEASGKDAELALAALRSELADGMAEQKAEVAESKKQLEVIQATLESVDDRVEGQLVRFRREQKLTTDGLEGRISALEKATQTLSGERIESIRSDLATLKQTVTSIDASRAQLTSRLVRLSDEVGQLRAGSGAQ